MDVDAVLFDLDGVLIDSREVWFHLVNAAAREFGAALLGRAEFDASFGMGVEADAERLGCTIAEIEAFYAAHYMDHGAHVRFEPHAASITRQLSSARYRTALVTNSITTIAREILAREAIVLDTIVGWGDVTASKPAPDGVLEACKRLGVTTDRALLVGDSAFDEGAARAAGVRFVGYGRPGDARIDALAELPALLGLR